MRKKSILIAGVTGLVLLIAGISFAMNSSSAKASNDGYVEGGETGTLDDVKVIIDDSTTFEHGSGEQPENTASESSSMYGINEVEVIFDDSTTFESEQ